MSSINTVGNSSILQQIQQQQEQRLEELSSGRRINSAADGAAAQQIIDRLTTEVEGNRQAISNSFDGISLAQVAEGGLSGISEDVSRIRELTIQSGNGILSDSDRTAIQGEISALQDNISQTIEQTTFAGQELLSEEGDISFQVGSAAGTQIDVSTQNFNEELDAILNVDVTTQSIEDSLAAADAALETVGAAQSELGAVQNRFESTARNLSQNDVNVSAARARIADTDFAQSTSSLAASSVQGQAALTIQAQANQQQGQVLALLN